MTFGQKMVLQQIQLVAHARGWDMLKSIKKTQEVLEWLQKMYDSQQEQETGKPAKTGRAISSPEEAKLIAQAEQLLKDLQDHDTPNPADPAPPSPSTPPL